MSARKTDYHALLTVYGFSKMDARTRKRLASWLLNQAKWLSKVKPEKVTSGRYSAKLMK